MKAVVTARTAGFPRCARSPRSAGGCKSSEVVDGGDLRMGSSSKLRQRRLQQCKPTPAASAKKPEAHDAVGVGERCRRRSPASERERPDGKAPASLRARGARREASTQAGRQAAGLSASSRVLEQKRSGHSTPRYGCVFTESSKIEESTNRSHSSSSSTASSTIRPPCTEKTRLRAALCTRWI